MFTFDSDLLAASMFDNLVFVSKGLLLVRSIVIGVGFQKTQSTLSEELLDLLTRLMMSILYTVMFMIAIYLGMVCGYSFGPLVLRVFWAVHVY